jgi:hypothetical protein
MSPFSTIRFATVANKVTEPLTTVSSGNTNVDASKFISKPKLAALVKNKTFNRDDSSSVIDEEDEEGSAG